MPDVPDVPDKPAGDCGYRCYPTLTGGLTGLTNGG